MGRGDTGYELIVESEEHIKQLPVPIDWNLNDLSISERGSIFVVWEREDGVKITVSPYPIPHHKYHRVEYTGDESSIETIEGKEDSLKKCLELLSKYTDDKEFRNKTKIILNGYSNKDLLDKINNFDHLLLCKHCYSDKVKILSKEIEMEVNNTEIVYEYYCNDCEQFLTHYITKDEI